MEIVFLGTGSSVFPGERAHSSIALYSTNSILLLDAGPPLQQRLEKEKLSPNEVDLVVITHIHPDHVLGLPGLLHDLKAMGKTTSPIIVTPFESSKELEHLLKTFGPSGMELKIRSVTEGSMLLFNRVTLFFKKVIHSIPTLSVKVVEDENSLFYSSDTAYMPELAGFASCDIGIHEATIPIDLEDKAMEIGMHSSPRQAVNILSNSKIRVLTHISKISFRKKFESPIDYIVAYDGLRLKI